VLVEIFYGTLKNPKEDLVGILLGVDRSRFDIGAIREGDYYVKFHLCNKDDSFKWALVVVYGPAQDDQKQFFLSELVNMCSREALPTWWRFQYFKKSRRKE
jgi:hypothetical protein